MAFPAKILRLLRLFKRIHDRERIQSSRESVERNSDLQRVSEILLRVFFFEISSRVRL